MSSSMFQTEQFTNIIEPLTRINSSSNETFVEDSTQQTFFEAIEDREWVLLLSIMLWILVIAEYFMMKPNTVSFREYVEFDIENQDTRTERHPTMRVHYRIENNAREHVLFSWYVIFGVFPSIIVIALWYSADCVVDSFCESYPTAQYLILFWIYFIFIRRYVYGCIKNTHTYLYANPNICRFLISLCIISAYLLGYLSIIFMIFSLV